MSHKFNITAQKVWNKAIEYDQEHRNFNDAFDLVRESLKDNLTEVEKRGAQHIARSYLALWEFNRKLGGARNDDPALLKATINLLEPYPDPKYDVPLESNDLCKSVWQDVQSAFMNLSKVYGFGATGASKFLGALYPQLCVMWDRGSVTPLAILTDTGKKNRHHNIAAFFMKCTDMRRPSTRNAQDCPLPYRRNFVRNATTPYLFSSTTISG